MKKSVELSDKGRWVMLSSFIPFLLFLTGSNVLREFGAPAALIKAFGVLCLIAIFILLFMGMLMMRCPLCNHLNAGRYPYRTVKPYCRKCGVEFVERQYKLW